VTGPEANGKSQLCKTLCSIASRKYNNGATKVKFQMTEAALLQNKWVGSGPASLEALRSFSEAAAEDGSVCVTVLEEVDSLLRSRETQNLASDGGSSIDTHEAFLSITDGPRQIQGLLICNSNMPHISDESTRSRFQIFRFGYITPEIMIDKIIYNRFKKDPELFDGTTWEEIRQACEAAMNTVIGHVNVGAEIRAVSTRHLSTGRAADKVVREALRIVDLSIYLSHEKGIMPIFKSIEPSLMYVCLVRHLWNLFSSWDQGQAQRRLGESDLVRDGKSKSITNPVAVKWEEIVMPEEYDIRNLISALSPDAWESAE
jgi:AAA+ superfamily predicted ATPase